MQINTIQGVRSQIERSFPGLAPFELTSDSLDALAGQLKKSRDMKHLRHIQQQAVLAEGIAAVRRGESASYLSNVKVWG